MPAMKPLFTIAAVLTAFGATAQRDFSKVEIRTVPVADGKEAAMLPVITFGESASVHFNGLELRLMHHGPGHTDGDSVVEFTGAGVIHMGDLFFNGRFPFIDLGSGGSVDGYTRSVKTVLDRLEPGTRIIPGHGSLATVDDLKAFHAMLVETSGVVRKARAAGDSLDAVKRAGLPPAYEDWGSGFISTDRWIETLYKDRSGDADN